MKEEWILQTEDGKYEFWDTYLHNQCVFITSQNEYPFLQGEGLIITKASEIEERKRRAEKTRK